MDQSDKAVKAQKIQDLAEAVFMGLNLARVSNSNTESESELVSVIHVKNVSEGLLTSKEELERVNIPYGKLGHQKLQSGDVLVSARGTLLKCAVMQPTHQGCIASANFIVIRMGSTSSLHPELLCAFLRQPDTQALLMSRVSSTAQPALTIRDLEFLSVDVPPRDIQEVLVRLVCVSDEQYRTAVDLAQLRREEALGITANYMGIGDA
ncbi:hypothetical protein [Hoeflea sp.]|uniref:hypothetical protein n=1 Tax=Hoeflea sp. TaxID=1940281 RepID=UPI003BAE9B0C